MLCQEAQPVLKIAQLRLPYQRSPIQFLGVLAQEPRQRIGHSGIKSRLSQGVHKDDAREGHWPRRLDVCESGIAKSAQLRAEPVVCRMDIAPTMNLTQPVPQAGAERPGAFFKQRKVRLRDSEQSRRVNLREVAPPAP
jgi:hypothetical protein